MRIYLTGFMGAGKSTVGECLAQQLGVPFVDIDREIERLAGFTVGEIFERQGEAGFRQLEHEALRRTLESGPAVIATGGGTVTLPANQQLLGQAGVSVWINPPIETVVERLAGSIGAPGRPLFRTPEQAVELFRNRLPGYESADLKVDVSAAESPEQVAARIRRLLGGAPCDT
jgi:shikimate kinase